MPSHGSQQPWRIITDFPYALQFWSYIGNVEQFSAFADNPTSPQETMWRTWGHDLIAARVRIRSAATPFVASEHPLEHVTVPFEAPSFPKLAHLPALQALCQRHWSAFQTAWDTTGGEGYVVTSRLHPQFNQVHVEHLVAATVRSQHRRTPDPLRLHIDFVHWAAMTTLHIADNYVLLGTEYLQRAHVGAFQEVLQNHIQKLA